MNDKRYLQSVDPLKRQGEAQTEDMGGPSPMGDPEDFKPSEDIQFPFEELHPFLQQLQNEHIELTDKNKKLKEAVLKMDKEHVINEEIKNLLNDFLEFFHAEFIPHNKREEVKLFPLLDKKLMAAGEHSNGPDPFTGVKLLEDDHIHALRLGAVLNSQLHLSSLISDFKSSSVIFQELRNTAQELAELIELHVFREDRIAFGLAQKLLSLQEMDEIYQSFQ